MDLLGGYGPLELSGFSKYWLGLRVSAVFLFFENRIVRIQAASYPDEHQPAREIKSQGAKKKKKNWALRQHWHCVARMDWREAIFSTPLAYWAFFYYSFALEFLSPID